MSSTTTALGPRAASLAAPPAPKSGFGGIPAPYIFSGLITLFLVIGQWQASILGDGYERLLVALGTAIGVELVLGRLLRGGWPNILSAYISGNSVAILLKPSAGLWAFATAAALAIASKYVLQIKGKHLWNPTNFSICALLLVAPASFAVLSHEWGNEAWVVAVIYGIGLVVVTRAKLLHISGTYIVCFLVLAFLRSLVTGKPAEAELAPITGAMYTLFTFFMITDPRTVVRGRGNQVLVVVLIALFECAVRLMADYGLPLPVAFESAPALLALFTIGPIAKAVDVLRG